MEACSPEFPPQIGKYKICGEIGSGSFSMVCQATNTETGKLLAVKIFPKSNLMNPGDEERFQREINAMVFLQHDNLLALRDFLWDDKNFYLILDYCPGGELFDYIVANEKLDEATAAIVFTQIVDAIDFCHNHGVAHRDLKPENILITEFPNIKVADFGLCGYVSPETKMKTFCGSPCYCAPECLCRVKYDGIKADVWSLGIILYAMITGENPWDITNTSVMLRQILKANYYVPDFLSKEVVDLLGKMIRPQPSERITVEEIKNHPWMIMHFHPHDTIRQSSSLPITITLAEYSKESYKTANFVDHGIWAPLKLTLGKEIIQKTAMSSRSKRSSNESFRSVSAAMRLVKPVLPQQSLQVHQAAKRKSTLPALPPK